VEKHSEELDRKLALYINSDTNGRGRIGIAGSHTLQQFILEVLRDVPDPAGKKALLESRRARRGAATESIAALGSGSDYVAFIDHDTIASLGVSFGGTGGGVYHSIYDSFYWYSHFSDTHFVHGQALAQVMSTALLRMADAPLVPFEFGALAATVSKYVAEIDDLIPEDADVDLRPVTNELKRLAKTAKEFESQYAKALKKVEAAPPDRLANLNQLIYRSERALALPDGLPRRPWYKHQLYAPGFYTGYGVKTLPGIREAVDAARWDEATQQAARVAQVLHALDARITEITKELRRL